MNQTDYARTILLRLNPLTHINRYHILPNTFTVVNNGPKLWVHFRFWNVIEKHQYSKEMYFAKVQNWVVLTEIEDKNLRESTNGIVTFDNWPILGLEMVETSKFMSIQMKAVIMKWNWKQAWMNRWNVSSEHWSTLKTSKRNRNFPKL